MAKEAAETARDKAEELADQGLVARVSEGVASAEEAVSDAVSSAPGTVHGRCH